jgi:ADP-ribose pyrophosphatase YjhB (NUDIX family)
MPAKISKKEFEKIYSKVTRLTVEVVVKTPEGIILTKRAIEPYKGMWHIPGGTVLFKEKLEDTVKRVAEEELGLNVGINRFLGFIYYPNEEKDRGFGWTIGAAYLAFVESGKLTGGDQGEVGVFKEIPKNTIKEQVEFLQKKLSIEQHK